MAGTVGAIFNGALQLGSAVGLAVVTSIQTSVETKHGGPTSYSGRAAVFWFVLVVVCAEAISLLVFYRVEAEPNGLSKDHAHTDYGKARQGEGVSEKDGTVLEDGKEVPEV